MDSNNISHRLEHKGVKPTANRMLVLNVFLQHMRPLTLSDVEELLPTMDKSSIFRVLILFREHDVLHVFEDGRGSLNYELCECDGVCLHNDFHIHFYCERCHRSYCLEQMELPSFTLPEGFSMTSASFVIKGECPECGRNRH